MKDNFYQSLVGNKVQLVPYRKKFVAHYHDWMQDEYILAMTASEPLSIEEEYDMQQSWRDDKKKCTFIVLGVAEGECTTTSSSEIDRMAGDVNMFLTRSYEENDNSIVAEIDIMIAEKKYQRHGLGREAVFLMMWYGITQLKLEKFYAKINHTNQPSIQLFESLGYKLNKYVEAFEEYEYLYVAAEGSDERQKILELASHVEKVDYLEEDVL